MRLQTILALFPALTYGCGVLVHSEITRRALFHIAQPAEDSSALYQDIVDNIQLILPSLRLGSFFPDWGYNCLPGTSDASEAAHWPPFVRAAVDHLHRTYGKDSENWSDDAWSLVGVILGIAGHGSADVTWHSLNMVGGLLKLVATEDFDGDFVTAHNLVDPGADFALAAALISSSKEEDWEAIDWHKGDWTIPNQDLIEIYKALGHKVTTNQLRFCASRGLAALQTELVIGKEALAEFRLKSPTTVANLETYYLGGIREMVADAVDCWVGVINWIEHKTPKSEEETWKYCNAFRAFVGFEEAGHKDLPSLKTQFSPSVEKKLSSVIGQIKEETNGGRLTLALDLTTSDRVAPPKKAGLLRSDGYDEPVYLTANVPFSHFGSSLAYGMFQEGWDTPILSVAAPYESESYLLPHSGGAYQIPLDGVELSSSDNVSKHNKLSAKSFVRSNKKWVDVVTNNLFGYAQATWSPIAPLKDLLVISSPGPMSFPDVYDYEDASGGAVTIFYRGIKVWSYKMMGYFMGQAGVKYFGSTLAAGQLGATQLGVEALVIGSTEADNWYYDEDKKKYFTKMREGSAFIMWLRGRPWDTESTSTRKAELPKDHRDPENRNGKIIIEATEALSKLLVDGEETFEVESRRVLTPQGLNITQFSKAIVFTPRSKVLLISAPGTGVFAYDFEAIDNFQKPIYTLSPPDTGSTKPLKTEFGYAMAAGFDEKAKKEWIAVSSPNEDGFRGAVYVYTISYTTAKGEIKTTLVKRLFDEHGDKFTRFGLVLKSDEKTRLIITSPEASDNRGAVWEVEVDIEKWLEEVPKKESENVWNNSQDYKAQVTMSMGSLGSDGDAERVPVLPGAKKGLSKVIEGTYPNSRLGTAVILPGDLNGDGKEDLVLSLPGGGVDGGRGSVAVLFKL
ncbi:hypothetical protein BJ508DRAFT_413929 [Ascobolus immersus RN42]|uniref:Phospholipase C/D domain-containing protein n=1 Tax=Ascobolus immersus RN42 TaxID=1160509 RepID=A0A3N4I9M6_ASCIM|nr:hypothetical protein BJ508DRAFT_413929 [Ascobolus immersus RN42]